MASAEPRPPVTGPLCGLIHVSVLPPASGKVLDYTYALTGEELLQPLVEETIEFADPLLGHQIEVTP